ncbi:MAG: DUF3307 domain-containing protein [Rhizobiales bacterium]|nr:DUF3307 domain-containing protein [Hyphomicrobiales bacterium]
MPEAVKLTLLAIAYLSFKHAIADFVLQIGYMHRNKGRYGHPGGILHAFVHALLTAPVFLIVPASQELMGAILAGEFVLHYHLDWMKEQITKGAGWTPVDAPFWYAIGVDQFLHMLTYIAITGLLIAPPL